MRVLKLKGLFACVSLIKILLVFPGVFFFTLRHISVIVHMFVWKETCRTNLIQILSVMVLHFSALHTVLFFCVSGNLLSYKLFIYSIKLLRMFKLIVQYLYCVSERVVPHVNNSLFTGNAHVCK